MDNNKVPEKTMSLRLYCKQFPTCEGCKFADNKGECSIKSIPKEEWID